jgi:hypothetical protein
MLDVTLSVLALIAGGVTIDLFTAATALRGGQNRSESGVNAEDFQTGNPS